MEDNYKLPFILIVDDSAYNRECLTEILQDSYKIMQAENGATALDLIKSFKAELACVLLDLNMTVLDGYEVMEEMVRNKSINSLPVIVVSSETDQESIRRAYFCGAADFISRPYDEVIIKKRVQNIINLYANQKKLAGMVLDQMKENERINDMMISILGHTIESRNRESNLHISNVSTITKILLEELNNFPGRQKIDSKKITLISRAAALHDLGKVFIPDQILNKPGTLTQEEFDVMKKHTLIGSQMLESEVLYKNEPLVKVANNICRWHHERYDGRGYPDGLVGDNIPVEAQVVSVADVYDSLTSERVYKKAYSHDQAIKMMCNNECGIFNPVLMKCLQQVSLELKVRVAKEK